MDVVQFKKQYLERIHAAKQMMAETNKASVLFIVQIPNRDSNDLLLPITRETISNIICFVEIGTPSILDFIFEQSVGVIDRIVLDIDHKRINSKEIIAKVRGQSPIPILEYSDLEMWANSSVNFILQNEKKTSLNILLLGHSYLTTRILQNFLLRRVEVYMLREDYHDIFALDDDVQISIHSDKLHIVNDEKEFDIIVGSKLKKEYDCTHLKPIFAKSLYDIGLQNFSSDYILFSMKNGVEVYRFDNRAAVSSIVLNLMETEELVTNVLGRVDIADKHLVSGGLMGRRGDLVVDNIYNPHAILGIADGHGAFVHECDYTEKERINLSIIKNIIDKE